MPTKPNVPCRHPGCPSLVPQGTRYCDKHKSQHRGEDRPSAARRGYNYRWRVESKRYLQEHPLCVRCYAEGRIVEATMVDHIIPHRGDQALFWDKSNWQSLCKHYHDLKTKKEDGLKKYEFKQRSVYAGGKDIKI